MTCKTVGTVAHHEVVCDNSLSAAQSAAVKAQAEGALNPVDCFVSTANSDIVLDSFCDCVFKTGLFAASAGADDQQGIEPKVSDECTIWLATTYLTEYDDIGTAYAKYSSEVCVCPDDLSLADGPKLIAAGMNTLLDENTGAPCTDKSTVKQPAQEQQIKNNAVFKEDYKYHSIM